MELSQNGKVTNRGKKVPLGAFFLSQTAILSPTRQGLELHSTPVKATKSVELSAKNKQEPCPVGLSNSLYFCYDSLVFDVQCLIQAAQQSTFFQPCTIAEDVASKPTHIHVLRVVVVTPHSYA